MPKTIHMLYELHNSLFTSNGTSKGTCSLNFIKTYNMWWDQAVELEFISTDNNTQEELELIPTPYQWYVNNMTLSLNDMLSTWSVTRWHSFSMMLSLDDMHLARPFGMHLAWLSITYNHTYSMTMHSLNLNSYHIAYLLIINTNQFTIYKQCLNLS